MLKYPFETNTIRLEIYIYNIMLYLLVFVISTIILVWMEGHQQLLFLSDQSASWPARQVTLVHRNGQSCVVLRLFWCYIPQKKINSAETVKVSEGFLQPSAHPPNAPEKVRAEIVSWVQRTLVSIKKKTSPTATTSPRKSPRTRKTGNTFSTRHPAMRHPITCLRVSSAWVGSPSTWWPRPWCRTTTAPETKKKSPAFRGKQNVTFVCLGIPC